MAAFLFVLCVLSLFSGVMTFTGAASIFQQIVGAISFIIAAILLIGAAIVHSIDKLITIKLLNENKGAK